MPTMEELQRQLKLFGYECGLFASKKTLEDIIILHSIVVDEKDINVAKLTDGELRKILIKSGLSIGPVTNHTRSIYQRKLLEILSQQLIEERDESETDDSQFDSYVYPNNSSLDDYENDENTAIRHDSKTNLTIKTSSKRNTSEMLNEIRSRPIIKSKDDRDASNDKNTTVKMPKKGRGSCFYFGIIIGTAIIGFFIYSFIEYNNNNVF